MNIDEQINDLLKCLLLKHEGLTLDFQNPVKYQAVSHHPSSGKGRHHGSQGPSVQLALLNG